MAHTINRVSVITEDADLFEQCAGVLGKWPLASVARQEPGALPNADLLVWDARASLPGSDSVDLGKCLFLVDREALARFPENELLFSAAVALVPTDNTRLAIAFEQAFSHRAAAANSGRDSVRKQKDALLQCLLFANLKLQQYDQDRTNFLNRALHDLRAPLTAITGYCSLLLSGETGPLDGNQSEALERICSSARRMARLSDGLFQLGMRQFRDSKPEFEKGDIQAVADAALLEIEPIARQKLLTITTELQEPQGDLFFEPERLTQVFINLLENACRYSPKRGIVEIQGNDYFSEHSSGFITLPGGCNGRPQQPPKANSYRVSISDSGPGIAPEDIGRVFEEYTSYTGGKDRSGTGLGLAICKGIVDSHGGRIWADPASHGATFSFVLPYVTGRQIPGGETDRK